MEITVKTLRTQSGMSQRKFAEFFNMPYKTLQGWENQGKSPAPYIIEMMEKILRYEGII